jgi:hypothetical protein
MEVLYMACNIGDFTLFCEEYENKFANCRYPYYANRSKQIVKKIFFGEDISVAEKDFIRKHTSTTEDEWRRLSEHFNELDIKITEEFMDVDNMPYAP